MSVRDLEVQLNGTRIGTLWQDGKGYLFFAYGAEYLNRRDARPLSHSLPLRAEPYEERECHPFFAGLLPDSEITRRALGDRLQVSKDDDFGLLSSLGRDCAGAVVIAEPGKISAVRRPWLEPLNAEVLAQMIADLPHRPLFAEEGDVMLSLAGAHDKAAVFVGYDGIVQLPHGGHPSSHILKVDIKGLPNSIRTECFCLKVAKDMGLKPPGAQLRQAGPHVFMLIARYDRETRVDASGRLLSIVRLHQEDFCQARAILPRMKYESKGGPSLADMFATLRDVCHTPAREIPRLLDFVFFNFLIGNPDSHAKNYSILYREAGAEIAPIYDINNAVAFRQHYKEQRARFAQSIGGEFDPNLVTPAHWDSFSAQIGASRNLVRQRLLGMAQRLPDVVAIRRERVRGGLGECPELDVIVVDVANRCARIVADLTGEPRPDPKPLPDISTGSGVKPGF